MDALLSRSCGGTFAGARSLANARTLQRKLQRQHTKKCLQQALMFAIGAKKSGRNLQGSVIARDLELFRESLYNGTDNGQVSPFCYDLNDRSGSWYFRHGWHDKTDVPPNTYGSAAGSLPSNCMSVASAAQHNESGFVLLDKSLVFTLNDADISIGSHCKASSGIWMPEHGDLSNADVDELTHHLQNEALSLKEGSSNADDDSSICRSEQPERFESSCVETLATGSLAHCKGGGVVF